MNENRENGREKIEKLAAGIIDMKAHVPGIKIMIIVHEIDGK
jgi:hypothetical protein